MKTYRVVTEVVREHREISTFVFSWDEQGPIEEWLLSSDGPAATQSKTTSNETFNVVSIEELKSDD